MPREIVELNLGDGEPWELTAAILGVIAYPDDRQKRADFADSVCVEKLLKSAEQDRAWANRPYSIRPRYLLAAQDRDACLYRITEGVKILQDRRQLAAAMAMAMFESELSDQQVRLLSGKKITQNSLAEELVGILAELGRSKGSDPAAIKRYAWRESKPVLHMCMSLYAHVHRAMGLFPDGVRSNGFEVLRLLDDDEAPQNLVVLGTLKCAQLVRELVASPVQEDEQIHIWIKDLPLG